MLAYFCLHSCPLTPVFCCPGPIGELEPQLRAYVALSGFLPVSGPELQRTPTAALLSVPGVCSQTHSRCALAGLVQPLGRHAPLWPRPRTATGPSSSSDSTANSSPNSLLCCFSSLHCHSETAPKQRHRAKTFLITSPT